VNEAKRAEKTEQHCLQHLVTEQQPWGTPAQEEPTLLRRLIKGVTQSKMPGLKRVPRKRSSAKKRGA